MQLEQSFEVKAPIDRVWAALIDVEHVAPCLPGAAVTGRADDGSYEGSFAVKIGPTSAAYAGRLEMTEVDEASHTATMQADGTDRRGQGGASATIVSRLSEVEPGTTRVQVDTEYRITGRLARFGRGGMIEDISRKLLRQFATNLQASLDVESAEADSVGGSGTGAASAAALAGGSAPAEPPLESAPADSTAPVVNGHMRAAAATDEVPFPGATPPPAAEPLDVGRLIGSTLIDRARANPLVPIAAVLLVLLLLGRRRRR